MAGMATMWAKEKATRGCGPAWPWFFRVAPGISRYAAWLVVYFGCIAELNSIKKVVKKTVNCYTSVLMRSFSITYANALRKATPLNVTFRKIPWLDVVE